MSQPPTHVHPTREDGVVAALSEGVGGPMGERGAGHRWWTPVRVLLLLTAVVFALGMAQKAPCASPPDKPDKVTDQSASTWQQNWVYSHMCYTDLRPLYVPRGFAELAWPYSGDAETRARYPDVMEYPVGISYWAWGAAWVTHWLDGSPDVGARASKPVDQLWGDPSVQREETIFTLVNAVGFAVLALLTTWLLATLDRRRPWDAAIFALSPTLLLTGLINWDLLAVVTVAGALWAWARGRPLLTGVLIGIGTATKLYPLFLLGGLVVVCVRRRRWTDLAAAVGTAMIAWVVADLPAYLSGAAQWKVFWTFNAHRGPDLGSLWLMISQASGHDFTPHVVNLISWILFAAWCVVVLALGLGARRVTLAQLGYLLVMGFLVVNKVYSPQYVLWLLPLAAIALPRWRDQLVWQACEVFYFCTVWWYLGGYLAPGGGSNAGFYWVGIVVRVLGELYLAAMILREMYRREPVPSRAATDVQPTMTIPSGSAGSAGGSAAAGVGTSGTSASATSVSTAPPVK